MGMLKIACICIAPYSTTSVSLFSHLILVIAMFNGPSRSSVFVFYKILGILELKVTLAVI